MKTFDRRWSWCDGHFTEYSIVTAWAHDSPTGMYLVWACEWEEVKQFNARLEALASCKASSNHREVLQKVWVECYNVSWVEDATLTILASRHEREWGNVPDLLRSKGVPKSKLSWPCSNLSLCKIYAPSRYCQHTLIKLIATVFNRLVTLFWQDSHDTLPKLGHKTLFSDMLQVLIKSSSRDLTDFALQVLMFRFSCCAWSPTRPRLALQAINSSCRRPCCCYLCKFFR